MKEYKYGKMSAGLSGKTGPIVMLLTILVLLCLGIVTGRSAIMGFSLVVALAYCIFIFGFSWWPNIKCDNDALYLEFLGWPIKIPWDDILGIKEVHYLPQKAWLVTARKITILHYLYSLFLSLKLVPGFVLWESLSNHSDLVGNIRREIKRRK
jgi:hypothetical protein